MALGILLASLSLLGLATIVILAAGALLPDVGGYDQDARSKSAHRVLHAVNLLRQLRASCLAL